MSPSLRMTMLAIAGAAALAFANAGPTSAENTVMVGGAPMYPSKNIVQNAVNSKDHTTLVVAVKAAGLVSALESKGPFTVFAPNNAAFKKLPGGTVGMLLRPENKKTLTEVLTYHVIPGRLSAKDLLEKIKAGNGKATLKTVEGADLTLQENDSELWGMDAKGDTVTVTIRNVMQSNGVIHVIDTGLAAELSTIILVVLVNRGHRLRRVCCPVLKTLRCDAARGWGGSRTPGASLQQESGSGIGSMVPGLVRTSDGSHSNR